MPRILYLSEYGTINGGENSLLTLIPYLCSAKFDIEVALPTDSPFALQLNLLGIRTHNFSCWDQTGKRKSLDQIRTDLAILLQETKQDIVHSNSLSMSRIAGPVIHDLNQNRKDKIIGIGHLRDIIKLKSQVIHDLNLLNCLIAVSDATKTFHVNQGMSSNQCKVLYNGVDLTKFQPISKSQSIDSQIEGIAQIGWVGQLGLRKGLDTFIESALTVLQQTERIQFLICGERYSTKRESIEYLEKIHQRIKEEDRESFFQFLGYQSNIHELMPKWEMLVHSAKQEPLGRVLLEAAACGLPIIASEVGGTREIFPNREAILVSPDHPEQMAQSILQVLQSKTLQDDMIQSSLERARKFDIKIISQQFIQLYQTLLN